MKQPKSRLPKFGDCLLKLLARYDVNPHMRGDFDEEFSLIYETKGFVRAWFWYWTHLLRSLPVFIRDILYWRSIMIKNYLKIALRNFQRHKGYSLINIAGFAIGMACCLLILLYVRHELSYDRYHKDVERVCRVVIDIRTQTANRVFALVSPTVALALKADYPQVEYAARAMPARSQLVRQKDKFFYEDRFMYADQELFDIFTIPFIQGVSQEALIRPNTLVVSQRMAHKYFGNVNPLGETLEINQQEYEITGVVTDSPENTHLKYDLIASLETLKEQKMMSYWDSTMFYTYLKLRPGVDMQEFSQQISRLADKYVGKQMEREYGATFHYFLQPLSSIHLHSHLRYEAEPPGNPVYITVFSFVGLFILIIACLNFMNLSTARAANRAKEVGLRKVVGAQKLQLIGQFLGESLLVAFLSLGVAMVIASFAIPLLNDLTGISLSFDALLMSDVLLSLIGGAVLVGLAAGLYPAFVLSAFRPAVTLKEVKRAGSHGLALRTVLVFVQFAISVVLIIATLTMYRQFNFMKNQYLGFEKEQKLVLPLREGINIQENFASVKDMFSKHSSVTGVTVSSTVPRRGLSNFGVVPVGEDNPKSQSMFHMYFDDDFIPVYGIDMVAGRAFQKEMKTDFMGTFLINKAAVRAFGWSSPEEALGKRLKTGMGDRVNPIIGVTKDFHYRGLQSEVEPLVMEFLPWFRYITLSIDITDLDDTLAFVMSQWKALWPGNPFEHFFLDADFDQQYRADEQIGDIFGIFTFLGLFIACLGLLGLASFTAASGPKKSVFERSLEPRLGKSSSYSPGSLQNGFSWPTASPGLWLIISWTGG
jgi:putative ABC transport system permease protein